MYSAHDSTLEMIYASLDLSSWQCRRKKWLERKMAQILTPLNNNEEYCITNFPMYASTVIFELYYDEKE